MKPAVRVAVTGAAGHIGYSILFRIASGEMLGKDQPVILQLLELPIPEVQQHLQGIIMELDDCAFPLLQDVIATSDPNVAFKDADYALLIGAKPRGKGMERADLLMENAKIFIEQGKALNAVAKRDVKVVVCGNPVNTNAYIAMKSAPDLKAKNFTALLRLDHNRALTQIAKKANCAVGEIQQLAIWGNHSPTMYSDYRYATVQDKKVSDIINDTSWYQQAFQDKVGKRGAEIIAARGASSAASAASATLDHIHDWATGTQGQWVTMGVPSDGSYGIPEGVVFGFPVTIDEKGEYHIVQGLEFDAFSQQKINDTLQELLDEQQAVAALLK